MITSAGMVALAVIVLHHGEAATGGLRGEAELPPAADAPRQTQDLPAQPPAAEPRKSFWSRLNPVNLVRGKDKSPPEEGALTPIPPPVVPSERRVAAALGSRSVDPTPVGEPPAAAPAPSFRRYSYTLTASPPAGNRASAQPLFLQGVQAQKKGLTVDAIAAYRRAIQADPAFFDAHYNLGLAAFQASDWPEALKACEQALAIRPSSTSARYNFALALKRADYPVDAANELERLLGADPNQATAEYALANLYAQTLDDRAKARVHYQRVLELRPQHPHASAIRRWLASPRNRG